MAEDDGSIAAPLAMRVASAGESPVVVGGNLLDRLSPEDRALLLNAGRPWQVAAGEVVVRQGSIGDCLFVVEEGELAVVRSLPGDEEKVLITARPGMILGELAVLDRGARSASLRVIRNATLRVIDLGEFEALTLHHAQAGHRILRAVAAEVHARLKETRRFAASKAARPATTKAAGAQLDWVLPGPDVASALCTLRALAGIRRPEIESMMPCLGVASLPRGADLVLPEPQRPGIVVVLRGALSPWLDDANGPEVTMPAVGPGGHVDYAAALGLDNERHCWRVRSPTQLLRLDPALFDADGPLSARLMYALSRDLATTLRRTLGLAMHFGMAWERPHEHAAHKHRHTRVTPVRPPADA